MKKSIIALSLAVAASGALAGGVNPAAPVAVAANGIGDLMLAPTYMGSGGWNTEVKVINTSSTLSTVAKVVIFERANSAEVLDFLVYLSPGDAWAGTISCNTANCSLTSTDDSVLTSNNTFASAASPATYTWSNNFPIGYVGVFENAAWNLGAAVLPKATVKARYDADLAANVAYTEANTANILAGKVRLNNTLSGATASLPMFAWVNYDNAAPLTIGSHTNFGGDRGYSPSFTTTTQLEDTFWSSNFVTPFDLAQGVTIGSVTFPTRTTWDNIVHGGLIGRYPFNNVTKSPVNANVTVRDMQENTLAAAQMITSPMPATARPAFAELGFYFLAAGGTTVDASGTLNTIGTSSYTQGWANVAIDTANNGVGFAGAPAVVTNMVWGATGFEWGYAQSNHGE